MDSPNENCISIVIVDANAITSDLLKHAFGQEPGYDVVGCARTVAEAVQIVTVNRPDIAIITATEKGGSTTALAVLDEFARIGASVRAVVISSTLTDIEAASYLRAHARGVLSGKDADFAVLRKCLACVHSGQIWAHNEHLVCLVESLSRAKSLRVVDARGEPILSLREEEVLQLLATGLTNRDLASTLKLSEHTVKNHLFRIFDKLGVSSRIEAVLYAMNHREEAAISAKPALPVRQISARPAQVNEWRPARLSVVKPNGEYKDGMSARRQEPTDRAV